MTIPESTIVDRWTHLSGELVDGYALRERLRVHIYREGEEYVASLDRVPIIAFGASDVDALQSLRAQIVEHLLWLEDANEKLSPRLKREREQMRSFMLETHG